MAIENVAVIGCGSIGRRHIENLGALGCSILAYDPNRYASYAITNCSTEQSAIDQSDAVVIASPTEFHAEQLHRAVMAGKHVLVEKPITNNSPGAVKASLAIAREKKLIVKVGYNLRLHGAVKKVRAWLLNDAIGTPLWAHFVVAQKATKRGYLQDGVILNWSHEIDLALHLLGGRTELASASARVDEGRDTVADITIIHADNQCRSTIHLDYITEPQQRYFSITGTRGRINCDLLTREASLTNKSVSEQFCDKGSFDQDYLDEISDFIKDPFDSPMADGFAGLAVANLAIHAREVCGL